MITELQYFNAKPKRKMAEPAYKFRINVRWMHGDADMYVDSTIDCATEQEVLDFLELVDAYHKMRGDRRERSEARKLPHYDDFFEGDPWPGDVTTDGMFLAALDRVDSMEYYDGNEWVEIEPK